MRFYLKVINPILALLALILCSWAAIFGDDKVTIAGIVAGGFTSYFFAKGLFTSGALFLFGSLLEATIKKENGESGNVSPRTVKERILFFSFLIASIGLLAGLFFWGKGEISSKTDTKYEIQNPSGLKVIEYHQVKETDRLAISITLQNSGNSEWKKVAITSELLLGGKYTGERGISFEDVKQGEIEHGLISFDDIRNELVKDSVVCQFKIEGNPKRR